LKESFLVLSIKQNIQGAEMTKTGIVLGSLGVGVALTTLILKLREIKRYRDWVMTTGLGKAGK